MESAAPPAAVLLSEATARLVDHAVMPADPEWVDIKGSDAPVRGRGLLSIGTRDGLLQRGTDGDRAEALELVDCLTNLAPVR